MSHRIRKRSLQEDFGSDASKLSSHLEVMRHIRQGLVEVRNRGIEVVQDRRPVCAADEKSTRIS